MTVRYFKVAVDSPLGLLTYSSANLSEAEIAKLLPGTSVTVPLVTRSVNGVVWEEVTDPFADAPLLPDGTQKKFEIKSIKAVSSERPRLTQERLEWTKWITDYYCFSVGQALQFCFPPLERNPKSRTRKKSSWIQDDESTNSESIGSRPVPLKLNAEQHSAFEAIEKSLGQFSTHLLFGVTGSGKTEVYLEAIEKCIERGLTALVLVPEISLTPQLVNRFNHRFPNQLAVLHSQLTPREKTNNWWLAHSGDRKVLIGARSALFCPMPNLGLIVIDEEHEASFKQEDGLRYHARDAAIALAQRLNCPVVLGSATPSLESWQNAISGRSHLHRLPNRAASPQKLSFDIVDLRQLRETQKAQTDPNAQSLPFWLSGTLYERLRTNLERNEQSALFLNRRGIAQAVVCNSCGDTIKCPNCSVSLTMHGRKHLLCHYCEYSVSLPEVCLVCKDGTPKPLGLGTELVENDLKSLFPAARLTRLDRDEIQNRTDLEAAIESIENHETDIIIGTQMIAKGLDFEKLTVVGLVLADVAFNMPDFRASERAFQLITQVAGRAGRHLKDRPGEVVIQTYNPDHPAVQFAIRSDTEGFILQELNFRNLLNYPPFGRLGTVRVSGAFESAVQKFAAQLARFATHQIEQAGLTESYQVLGPAPSPIAKINSLFRYQILIKSLKPNVQIHKLLRHLQLAAADNCPARVEFHVDVDAQSML